MPSVRNNQSDTPQFPQVKVRHTLAAISETANSIGFGFIAREAIKLAKRATDERLLIACVGAQGREPSALIDSLAGERILPTEGVSFNDVPIIVHYGTERSATIRFSDRRKQVSLRSISDYVTDQRNPYNREAVDLVEVSIPSALLALGISLIHAPIETWLLSGELDTAKPFFPVLDVAVIVLGADPPISNCQLDLVDKIASKARRLLFVLDNAELLDERSCTQASIAIRQTLARHFRRAVGPVFRTSARRWLNQGSRKFDEEALTATLGCLAREAGDAFVCTAERQGVERLIPALLSELERFSDALVRPVDETRNRLQMLDLAITAAEQRLTEIFESFGRANALAVTDSEKRRDAFVSAAIIQAAESFEQNADSMFNEPEANVQPFPAFFAESTSRRLLEQWFKEDALAARSVSQIIVTDCTRKAMDLFKELETSADAGLAAISSFCPDEDFESLASEPIANCPALAPPNSFFRIVRLFESRSQRRRSVRRQVCRHVEGVLLMNTSRVLGDLDRSTVARATNLEERARSYLGGLRESNRRMLTKIEQKQRDGGDAIMRELKIIEDLRYELQLLQVSTNDKRRPRDSKWQ